MKGSYRTTSAGILAIIAALATAAHAELDNDPMTQPNWEFVGAAVFGGIGLILARDNKVTSKDAGAEP